MVTKNIRIEIKKAIKEMKRILKPVGKILLAVPYGERHIIQYREHMMTSY